MDTSIVSYQSTDDQEQFDSYDFPVFYHSFDGKKFYFKNLNLELGSINFVVGDRKMGKTLFLRCLTGLECPVEKPSNRSFLKYDIVYKPEFISPKFSGSLREFIIFKDLGENHNFFKYFNGLDMAKYMDVHVKNLPEEQKQILSFLLFLLTEGLIYIMDCPTHLISKEKREKMMEILNYHCERFDKIGIVVENDDDILQKYRVDNNKFYHLRKFGDNEFYGQME